MYTCITQLQTIQHDMTLRGDLYWHFGKKNLSTKSINTYIQILQDTEPLKSHKNNTCRLDNALN